MTEPVRLVVWDLDETFWKGTFTEGGITEYVQAHHDIVVELAHRGIMSSICSKNDKAAVVAVLKARGIFDYFIFPSIDWNPKGPRLAQLIADVQLRPATVMFIDDNPSNRAEAAALIPELQVEDDHFISKILDDGRFEGKADPALSRLNQYKMLEAKSRDETKFSGNNEDFLRRSNIRVYIDYDVAAQIDRAVELVQRTSQLNYTKCRLAGDAGQAGAELLKQIAAFDCQAGLVRVVDDYGDYGYVGFFVAYSVRSAPVENAAYRRLSHFCFSCRTLGMFVEQWVYEHLGFPELNIVGDVVTPLSATKRVDWIRQIFSLTGASAHRALIAPRITLIGGCEAHSISAYLAAYTGEVKIIANYAANGLFVRPNFAAVILDMCERTMDSFREEARVIGLPLHLEAVDPFSGAPEGTLYVMNFGMDMGEFGHHLYRHKRMGWKIYAEIQMHAAPSLMAPPQDIIAHIDAHPQDYDPANRAHILAVAAHFSENYETVRAEFTPETRLREIISQIPQGSKLVFYAHHDERRSPAAPETLVKIQPVTEFVNLLRKIAAEYEFVGVVSVSEVIQDSDEILEAEHYSRDVYRRLADKLLETSAALAPRSEAPASRRKFLLDQLATMQARAPDECRDIVNALYEAFFFRAPDSDYYVDQLQSGALAPAQLIRIIRASEEYSHRWAPI